MSGRKRRTSKTLKGHNYSYFSVSLEALGTIDFSSGICSLLIMEQTEAEII